MPPRLCVQETCTVVPTIDPVTSELILDVPLDPLGGLDCADGVGVAVQRFGNVAPVNEATVDPDCVHRIYVTDQNNLYVEPRPMIPVSLPAGVTVDFVTPGDHVSLTTVFTNTFGCDIWARITTEQPQVVLVAAPIPEPESPAGTGLKHLRFQGTSYIDSTVSDINGSSRINDRHDVNIRVPDGDDGNTHITYHGISMLVGLTPGQSTTITFGVNTGLLQGFRASGAFGAGFTALRNWIEVYRTGL